MTWGITGVRTLFVPNRYFSPQSLHVLVDCWLPTAIAQNWRLATGFPPGAPLRHQRRHL